jgi:hypothetical protein
VNEARAMARKRLGRIAAVYAALTAAMVVMNLVTHGPTWWYFAAAGLGFAIVMQALRLRR